MFLLNEARALCGSYNAVAQRIGAPWSTVGYVANGSMPPSPSLVVALSLLLARDPLADLAKVEFEAQRDSWSRHIWLKFIQRDAEAA